MCPLMCYVTDTTSRMSPPQLAYTRVTPRFPPGWARLLPASSPNTKRLVWAGPKHDPFSQREYHTEKREREAKMEKNKKGRTAKRCTDTRLPTPSNQVHRSVRDHQPARPAHSSSCIGNPERPSTYMHKKGGRSPGASQEGFKAVLHRTKPLAWSWEDFHGQKMHLTCKVPPKEGSCFVPGLLAATWFNLHFLGKPSPTAPNCGIWPQKHAAVSQIQKWHLQVVKVVLGESTEPGGKIPLQLIWMTRQEVH